MPTSGVVDFRTRVRIAGHVKGKMEQLQIPNDAELARRLKVHRSTVSRMLRGQLTRLGLDLFIKLHRILGIDATLMLGEDFKKKGGPTSGPNGLKAGPSDDSRGASVPP